MGHLTSEHKAYVDLQARLDRTHIGLPDGESLFEILRLLYTEEEARIAARMPVKPISAALMARRVKLPEEQLIPLLEHMADVGTVMDLIHPRTGEVSYMLSPPVVGFFEFSLMRRRQDLDQPALAMAMDAYMSSGAFFSSIEGDLTQIGRTLVNEEALAPEVTTEILAYERASEILRSAEQIGVSLCYCRHKAEHLGHACDAPQEVCFNINGGFDYVSRHGIARQVEITEALEILARCRELGLVQIADNVARRPIYLCNCCACCCLQLRAINRHGISTAVHTSNFIAVRDGQRCRGCGHCARRCPVQAIHLEPVAREGQRKGRMRAVIDESICLGCGLCHGACRHGTIRMEPRAVRVLTPESTLERVVNMAIDRGKLQHLIFDEGEGLPVLVANRLLGKLLDLPPARRVLAQKQIRSRFVESILQRFRGRRPARGPGA